MKKKIVILLGVVFALVLSFALTACGKVALKLTFKVDGEVYQTVSTSGNEVISMPENPTKDGFIFDGWFWDEGTWQKPFTANSLLDTPLSSDMSVYAKFSVDATPTGTEIKAEGFEKNNSVYYTKVSNTTETFSFIGKIKVADGATWRLFTDIACTVEVPSRTKEISVGDNKFYILVTNGNDVNSYLFVVRRRPIYTVTYRTNNGSYITSQRVEEDSYATDFTPTCAGYTFKAWNYDFTQPIVGDTTITASLDTITYNISYDLTGGEFEGEHVKTYTVETPTFALATPVKRGYTFLGWYDGETKVEKITRWSIGDRSFAAKWGATPYSITYNLGGGTNATNNPTTYTVEQTIALSDASRDGYRFVGWKEGNVIEKGNVGARTFTAQWEVVTYSIFYNLDGGEFGGEYHQSYDIETDTFSLVAPVKRGYTFLGWYDGETKVVQIEKGNFGEKRFTAKWEVVVYGINYTVDYGENNENNELTYTVNDEVEFFDPYYINGDFVKWQDINGNKITKIEKGSIGNVSIAAVYDLYDVKLRLNNDDTFTVVGKQTEGNTVNIKSEYKGKKVTSIGSSAFSGCSGLTSITIPDSVTSIGTWTFSGCSSLTRVSIPDNVTSIGGCAFYNCSSLMSVTIPNSVTSIGDSVFSGCNSLKYNEYDNAKYLGNDTNPYLLLVKVESADITSYIVDDKIRFIHSSAFSDCSSLTNIKISDSVMSIGSGAFFGCPIETAEMPTSAISSIPTSKLKTVILTSGENIKDSAFKDSRCLANVTIPNSITSIGKSAFSGCSSLVNITIPDSVTSIGDSAFYCCSSLTNITIPDSVTSIGKSAFYGCTQLKSMKLPFVGGSLNATNEESVFGFIFGYEIVNSSVNVVYAVYQYSRANLKYYYFIPQSLRTVEITGGAIGDNAFYNCSNLTSVTIDDGVVSIGYGAFHNCSSLTSIAIPDSVLNISKDAFYYNDCPIEIAIMPTSAISSIPTSKLKTVILTSGESIGYGAFHNCSGLTSITIPDSVTSIEMDAFSGCSSLTSVYYKGGEESWTNISIGIFNGSLISATRYYYSESEPEVNSDGTAYNGNYWRYVDGVPTVWAK